MKQHFIFARIFSLIPCSIHKLPMLLNDTHVVRAMTGGSKFLFVFNFLKLKLL